MVQAIGLIVLSCFRRGYSAQGNIFLATFPQMAFIVLLILLRRIRTRFVAVDGKDSLEETEKVGRLDETAPQRQKVKGETLMAAARTVVGAFPSYCRFFR